MTDCIKYIANKLNNCAYRNEMNDDIEQYCKENNIVVVFGASDDLMEFDGAFYDEFGGTNTIYLNDEKQIIYNECNNFECVYYNNLVKSSPYYIRGVWNESSNIEYSWTYDTNLHHETFDVLDDGERYCKGIVFQLNKL